MPQGLKAVEIFSIGTWQGNRKVMVDGSMLDRMVSNFKTLNPIGGFPVAVKLGHNNRVGEPAFGWVSEVYRQGNTLLADFIDIPASVLDMVNSRQYNSVSVEIWPKVEHAGQVFNDVLGAVALLGAEWPAVKGLQPLSASLFSEGQGEWIEKEQTMTFTQEQHDALIAASKAETAATFQAQLTAANAATTEATERADRAEGALKVFKDDAAKATVLAFIDKAIADGRILPKQKDEIMVMAQSFGVMSAAKFKVGDKEKTGLEMFQSFLENLPVKIVYGEKAGSRADRPGTGTRADDALNDAAKALMSANTKLTYRQAVDQALAADEGLKAAYFAQRNEQSNSDED